MDVWEKVKIEGAISRQGVRYNDLTEEQKQIDDYNAAAHAKAKEVMSKINRSKIV